ncbi:MAG TPA: DUF6496 domain-containing protein [Thermoanaerobaculia bacterium]|jgi:hypothetical protein|nr:DUF6496 domain-containing protein [Thermoanaerobaculia bacterium]
MARKYGKKASHKVERAMHERKHGTLKSGRSGKKVKSRKQAIAIGLSEARREGDKVPSRGRSRKSSGRSRSHSSHGRSSSRSHRSSSRSRSRSHGRKSHKSS